MSSLRRSVRLAQTNTPTPTTAEIHKGWYEDLIMPMKYSLYTGIPDISSYLDGIKICIHPIDSVYWNLDEDNIWCEVSILRLPGMAQNGPFSYTEPCAGR